MGRKIYLGVVALSAALFVATVVMWIWSYCDSRPFSLAMRQPEFIAASRSQRSTIRVFMSAHGHLGGYVEITEPVGDLGTSATLMDYVAARLVAAVDRSSRASAPWEWRACRRPLGR